MVSNWPIGSTTGNRIRSTMEILHQQIPILGKKGPAEFLPSRANRNGLAAIDGYFQPLPNS